VLGNLEKVRATCRAPLNIPRNGYDDLQMVDKVIMAIDRLAEDIHVPRHLKDFRRQGERHPMLAEGALKSTRLLVNNPRNLTLEDAKSIYMAAM